MRRIFALTVVVTLTFRRRVATSRSRSFGENRGDHVGNRKSRPKRLISRPTVTRNGYARDTLRTGPAELFEKRSRPRDVRKPYGVFPDTARGRRSGYRRKIDRTSLPAVVANGHRPRWVRSGVRSSGAHSTGAPVRYTSRTRSLTERARSD